MKTSHNTKDPSELCTICEININVPSAELGPTVCTDRHTHTKKRVALFYVVLETLRRQCTDFLQQQETFFFKYLHMSHYPITATHQCTR